MTTSPIDKKVNDLSFLSEKEEKRKPSFHSYFLEDSKIEKNIKIIEYEIKKHNYSMDQRCFIENIIKLLDALSKPLDFSKVIFFHILDFSNFSKDSPILLYDFFKSFFRVYETMRINSEILNKNVSFLNQKLYNLNLKLNSLKHDDKELDNQLSPSAELKIKILSIDSNKSLTENFILLISQSRTQMEMPFQAMNSFSVNNLSDNPQTLNYNKSFMNQNLNYNLSNNNNLDLALNKFSKTDNTMNFRKYLVNGLDNSNFMNGVFTPNANDSHINLGDNNNLKKKNAIRMKVENSENIIIYLFNPSTNQKILVEKINMSDLAKNFEIIKDYPNTVKIGDNLNLNFRLSISLIDSMFLYKKNKSLKLETSILEKKEELETLNNCLSHIDATLGRYYLNNSNNLNLNNENSLSPFRNENNNDQIKDFNIIVNGNNLNNPSNAITNAKYLSDDFHYTEKVENYFLKIIGRDLFKWDSILFFFNKILIMLSLFSWIFKFDLSTSMLNICVFGIENRFIGRTHLKKCILFAIFAKMEKKENSDAFGFSNEFINLETVIYSMITILKMIFSFCLWRLYLEFKLGSINKFIGRSNFIVKDKPNISEPVEKTRKSVIGFHPKIKSTNNANKQITIRMDE